MPSVPPPDSTGDPPPDPQFAHAGDVLSTPIDPEHLRRVERLASAAIADHWDVLKELMK